MLKEFLEFLGFTKVGKNQDESFNATYDNVRYIGIVKDIVELSIYSKNKIISIYADLKFKEQRPYEKTENKEIPTPEEADRVITHLASKFLSGECFKAEEGNFIIVNFEHGEHKYFAAWVDEKSGEVMVARHFYE